MADYDGHNSKLPKDLTGQVYVTKNCERLSSNDYETYVIGKFPDAEIALKFYDPEFGELMWEEMEKYLFLENIALTDTMHALNTIGKWLHNMSENISEETKHLQQSKKKFTPNGWF